MMNGFSMFMMSAWIPLVILFSIIVIAAAIWLITRTLNRKKTSTPLYTPQERADQPYERGYQSQRPTMEPSPKSEEQVWYPQPEDEQPRAHYPQSQEMPPQQR